MDGRWWKQKRKKREKKYGSQSIEWSPVVNSVVLLWFQIQIPSVEWFAAHSRESERCSCAGKGERYARRGEKEIRQKKQRANTRESPQAGPLRDVEPYTHSVRVDDDDRIKYEKQAEQRKPDFSSLFVYKLKFFFGRFRSPTTWWFQQFFFLLHHLLSLSSTLNIYRSRCFYNEES